MQQKKSRLLVQSYEEINSEEDFIDRRRGRDLDCGWLRRLRCGVADLWIGGFADIGGAGSRAGSCERPGTVGGANLQGVSASAESPGTADGNDDRDGTNPDRNRSLTSLTDTSYRYRRVFHFRKGFACTSGRCRTSPRRGEVRRLRGGEGAHDRRAIHLLNVTNPVISLSDERFAMDLDS
jgi:hypothetical protein